MRIVANGSAREQAQEVIHSTALTTAAGTRWNIPLSSFVGVNSAKVQELYLGVGNQAAPAQGGAGIFYVDDIGFGRSVPVTIVRSGGPDER